MIPMGFHSQKSTSTTHAPPPLTGGATKDWNTLNKKGIRGGGLAAEASEEELLQEVGGGDN